MPKLMYKSQHSHVSLRNGIFYFVRRIPSDVRCHYRADRISISLRTRSHSVATHSARSINQRLEDYWLGLRLQQMDIPAICLIKASDNISEDGYLLSEARDLYLRLKGINKDRVFIRTAQRNVGYVIRVLGDRPVTDYSSAQAAQFRDWLIGEGMGRNTVKRVFSSVRSIINLAIRELGLGGQNGFSGTFLPETLQPTERKPIPIQDIRAIQTICQIQDDDLRWLVALISDTGMRLGEAVGLLQDDIVLDTDIPYIDLKPHPWRRLKTTGSERLIPLVGASLWASKRILDQRSDSQMAFSRYCNQDHHNTNSASAALNKWLKGHAPEGCVIHSFRHSMRDRLRAQQCPSDIIDQIGGWVTPGVGQGYGSGYPLTVLRDWMVRMQ